MSVPPSQCKAAMPASMASIAESGSLSINADVNAVQSPRESVLLSGFRNADLYFTYASPSVRSIPRMYRMTRLCTLAISGCCLASLL